MPGRRSKSPQHDIALPRSFEQHYGEGVDRGLCLGGGGLFFVAWQVAYLQRLATKGVHVDNAERVVGTSAGSIVATSLLSGNLKRVHRELSVLSKVPALLSALAPAGSLEPSQLRALDMFRNAADGATPTVQAIGHAALVATTPPATFMRRNISVLAGGRRWPSSSLNISCVDAYSGQRCIVTREAGVSGAAAAAASSAVPGIFSPYPIGDRRCMDGGVSGTGLHLDVLGGAQRVLILGLSDGRDVTEAALTIAPGSIEHEIGQLVATGTRVEFRSPEAFDPDELMSPAAVPNAMAMGVRQADQDLQALQSFWKE